MRRQSSGQKNLLQVASEKYAASLTQQALAYLAGRGISETVARTRLLGVAVEPEPGHEALRGRLTVPYLTRSGVVQIKARALDAREPKYVGLTGIDPHLYGVNAFHRPGDVIAVLEGELDALVMEEVVGVPAVGVPGVHTWTKWMHRTFAGYSRVLVITDGDKPGQDLAERISQDLRDQAVLIPPPPGLDLTDWVLRDGPEAVREKCGL